ncbi:MAG: glutamine synthetase family protein [Bacteroidales bacterium]|nr:glutamine synthetase family protein [Bacteroidales bacterium]
MLNIKSKAELVAYCIENQIEFIDFHYCGWDGRLKTLNFVVRDKAHLMNILEAGERVDGSSLFPFVEAGKSDLYVVPRYRTAFRDPFAQVPTVGLLCSFFDREGKPFESSPEYVLRKAAKVFREKTGLEMQTMGELEYYVIAEDDGMYRIPDQRGYHESAPFVKFEDLRVEAVRLITEMGGMVKYAHSEVGNFRLDGKIFEQNEIEFLPVDICDAADQLVLAKWVMRRLAWDYGVTLTFAPKITEGKAGSGMHVHCKFTRDGRSVMVEGGDITDVVRRAIAGYMDAGTSLTAFGNPNPLSFMRLVPNQEAPTTLCWSHSNRSALVRVPLGWTSSVDMAAQCNPGEEVAARDFSDKATFEWRASDATANVYLLMAALCCAARRGFEMPDALEVARRTYVGLGVNIHDSANEALKESLEQLPASCSGAADALDADRAIYTSEGVFSDSMLDYLVRTLRSFGPEDSDVEENLHIA